MLGRSTTIIAVLVLSLALAGTASASGTSQDAASTHAYIRANFKLEREAEASVAPAQASVVRFNQKLGEECPKAGAGGPENNESQKVSYEAVGALWSITYGAIAGPIRTFDKAVKSLRWSNPEITHIAQHYAQSLEELASLPMPNLCGDVRAWTESDFRTVPATTLQIDQHAESIQGHTIPTKLLAPYERPSDRSIVAQTAKLETKLEQTETVIGFSDWDMVLETLGLNQ